MRDPDEIPEANEPRPLSKTKRKQAMHALQDIGKELVKLPAGRLEKLALPDELRQAVEDCRRFTKHEAIRRQLQYIGRLMRSVDEAPIARQLAAWRGESDEEKARLHRVERWRDRLIADDSALTDFVRGVPGVDTTRLRQLVRQAREEAAQGKPPRSSRALFRFVREHLEAGAVDKENSEN